MTDRLGPNCAQVTWVLGRLGDLSVENWRALADATHDAEREDQLQDTIVRVKRIDPQLIQTIFTVADGVANSATTASQRLRGDLHVLEVPVNGSGWTGDVEGYGLQVLAPEDHFPFQRAARDVLMLVAMRPYGSSAGFGILWSRFEEHIGLLKAEADGSVGGCVQTGKPMPPR